MYVTGAERMPVRLWRSDRGGEGVSPKRTLFSPWHVASQEAYAEGRKHMAFRRLRDALRASELAASQ